MKRTFGLIGKSLKHSFSQDFFRSKFEREQITDCDYQLFPLEEITHFPDLIKEHPDLAGLNVTIPYKESVIPYLDGLSEEAEAIGAVNVIAFQEGKLMGHNSDAYGFQQSLQKFIGDCHPQALILGTGGASKAIRYVLKKEEIRFLEISRDPCKGDLTYERLNKSADIFQEFNLIINTTPLGTFPNVEERPDIPYMWLNAHHYLYDLVYNPAKTRFLQYGEEQGAQIKNGQEMLELQAERSWKIWTEDFR